MKLFTKIAKVLTSIINRVFVEIPLRLLSRLEDNTAKQALSATATHMVALWFANFIISTFFPAFTVVVICMVVGLVAEQINYGLGRQTTAVPVAETTV